MVEIEKIKWPDGQIRFYCRVKTEEYLNKSKEGLLKQIKKEQSFEGEQLTLFNKEDLSGGV